MHPTPILLAALAFAVTTPAQEPVKLPAPLDKVLWLRDEPKGDAPRHTVVALVTDLAELRDQAAWLEELQRRQREHGVLVAALFAGQAPTEAGKVGAAFAVGAAPIDDLQPLLEGTAWPVRTFVFDDSGNAIWRGAPGDGLEDALHLAREGRLGGAMEWAQLRDQIRITFENSGDQSGGLRKILADCPHDGFAWGTLYLSVLWFDGDPEAARAVGKQAIAALGTDGPGLVAFADLALRGDRHDIDLAKALVVALAPVTAVARENALAQLTMLRALLRADRTREAGRMAQTLPRLLADRPIALAEFAALLAGTREPGPFQDLARKAVATSRAALEQGVDGPHAWRKLFAAEYAIALRCAGDAKAAAGVFERYLAHECYTGLYNDLNNDSWYGNTDLATMGHMEWLALALGEKMEKEEGAGFSPNNRDTLALAYFMTGQLDKAIEHQTEANSKIGDRGEYHARLQRYERTKALLAAAPGK